MRARFFAQSQPTYQLTASIIMPSMPVSIQKRTIFSHSSWNSWLPQLYCGRRTRVAGQVHAVPPAPEVFAGARAGRPDLDLRPVVPAKVRRAHHEERVGPARSRRRRRAGRIGPQEHPRLARVATRLHVVARLQEVHRLDAAVPEVVDADDLEALFVREIDQPAEVLHRADPRVDLVAVDGVEAQEAVTCLGGRVDLHHADAGVAKLVQPSRRRRFRLQRKDGVLVAFPRTQEYRCRPAERLDPGWFG